MNPADELRAAAARLRACLDDPQLTAGPWLSLDHGDRLLRNQPGDADRAPVYVVDEPMSNGANADYIELMHPGVGAALAAWLERVAHGWDSLSFAATTALDPSNPAHAEPARLLNEGPYDAQEALAVARLINATES
jgi:hypothetical protein